MCWYYIIVFTFWKNLNTCRMGERQEKYREVQSRAEQYSTEKSIERTFGQNMSGIV